MKYLFILLLSFISVNVFGQTYSLDVKFKEGDVIYYPENNMQNIKQVTQGFGYTFLTEIESQKKQGNTFFLFMWIDFTDTSTFKYYTKNGKNYIFQIMDKSFGKNNVLQDDDECRPIFDKTSKSIIFPKGTYLKYKVNFNGYTLTGTIDSFQANSLYFIAFRPKQDFQLNKTLPL